VPIGPSPAGLSAVALGVICVYPLCLSFRVAARSSRRIADEDFVVYARAKGLSEGQVLRRHVGAAVVPEIVRELPTILSFMQGTLFIVEYLFALPGIARFLFTTAFSGTRPGFYQVYQYNLGVFVLAGIGLAYVLVYAALRLSLALARKVLVNE
jgi:ABC-type dipeptide/oligopeptide/nickel transport system permease component